MSNQARHRISELTNEIRDHQFKYYVLDAPTVTDTQFDALLKELQALEAKHPELLEPDFKIRAFNKQTRPKSRAPTTNDAQDIRPNPRPSNTTRHRRPTATEPAASTAARRAEPSWAARCLRASA